MTRHSQSGNDSDDDDDQDACHDTCHDEGHWQKRIGQLLSTSPPPHPPFHSPVTDSSPGKMLKAERISSLGFPANHMHASRAQVD